MIRSLFLRLNLMAVIALTAGNGVFDDGDEGEGAFGFSFVATYVDNIALACSSEEIMIINSVVHGQATIDTISAMIAPSIPPFELAFEMGAEGMLVDHTGELAELPTDEENAEHLGTPDMLMDMSMGATMGQGSPNTRGRRRMVSAERQLQLRSNLKPAPLEMTPVLGFGLLEGVTDMDHPDLERRLKKKKKKGGKIRSSCPSYRDCPTKRGLGSTFYCMCFCGYRYGRRRLSEETDLDDLRQLVESTPEPTEEPETTSPTTGSPTASPTTGSPTTSPTSEPTESPTTAYPTESPTVSPEEIFAAKVEESNTRITKELEVKLKFMARHGITPCLGIPWLLEVKFTGVPEFTG